METNKQTAEKPQANNQTVQTAAPITQDAVVRVTGVALVGTTLGNK